MTISKRWLLRARQQKCCWRPTTQHTPAEHERLTADKISVIEQLSYKNKAFIIALQETHCTTADKLVIPNISIAGSVLSRKYSLATFVHERLEWSQRLSGCAETLQDTRSLTSTNHHARDSHQRPSRRSHTTIFMLVTSIANISTGVTTKHLTVRAWTPGQHPAILVCCITQRKQPAFSLIDGTLAPTQTWPSRVSAKTADCRTDVF